MAKGSKGGSSSRCIPKIKVPGGTPSSKNPSKY